MSITNSNCPKTGQPIVRFGKGSAFFFDKLGMISRLDVVKVDNARRFKAQAIVRKAAGRARLELSRGTYGSDTSSLRDQFVSRVAQIAADIEHAELVS